MSLEPMRLISATAGVCSTLPSTLRLHFPNGFVYTGGLARAHNKLPGPSSVGQNPNALLSGGSL